MPSAMIDKGSGDVVEARQPWKLAVFDLLLSRSFWRLRLLSAHESPSAYSVKIETSRQSFYFLVWPLSFALIRSVACLALEGSSLC